MNRQIRCLLLTLLLACAGVATASEPYNAWTDPCALTASGDMDSLLPQLTAAVNEPASADLKALSCAALGALDGKRWGTAWTAWTESSDDEGCPEAGVPATLRAELFLSVHVHEAARHCAQKRGDNAAAERAAAVRDGLMEFFMARANGATFDQGIPVIVPADAMSYLILLGDQVRSFWGRPYFGGLRSVFKVQFVGNDGLQQTRYFEWLGPHYQLLHRPEAELTGPWQWQAYARSLSQDPGDGPLADAVRVYAAYAVPGDKKQPEQHIVKLRELLQPAINRGDGAAVFELARYELELPGGDAKAAVDMLLTLADAGDARAMAVLAAPTLLGEAGLEANDSAASDLIQRAAEHLAPGEAEFWAGGQLAGHNHQSVFEWQERWLAKADSLKHSEGSYAYARLLFERGRDEEGLAALQRAAEGGYVTAMVELADRLGALTPAAQAWFQKAAHWSPLAMRRLAEAISDQQSSAARSLWRRAAQAGDRIAAERMGRQLLQPDTADADEQALPWLWWASSNGVPGAMDVVIAIDLRARAKSAKPERGLEIYPLMEDAVGAALMPASSYEYARRQETGDLVKKNLRSATRTYKQLASKEHPQALLRLAAIESSARPTKARSQRVVSLLVRAYAAGAHEAAAQLAELYADPNRRIADAKAAASWAAKAAQDQTSNLSN